MSAVHPNFGCSRKSELEYLVPFTLSLLVTFGSMLVSSRRPDTMNVPLSSMFWPLQHVGRLTDRKSAHVTCWLDLGSMLGSMLASISEFCQFVVW